MEPVSGFFSFLTNKALIFLVITNVYCGTTFDLPRNDIIILPTGEEINGKILQAYDPVVKIRTKGGERTIVRQVKKNAARDIIETGILKKSRQTGQLNYLGEEYIELTSETGSFKINPSKVRKIILSQENALDL